MDLKLSIRLNENLFLRDPETSDLGRRILKNGISLIHKLGFEAFTFKKLGEEIHTTEASIYRYFENKHRLLLYIITWYWSYLEYQVVFSINNLTDSEAKIKRVIDLLTRELDDSLGTLDFDKRALYNIVISESSKAYLSKDVDEHNSIQLFKPYKDLCDRIALLFNDFNPTYDYPHSLASTVVEAAHFQYFFAQHLPRLTEVKKDENDFTVKNFLEHLVFATLSK
ncbi:MAG: TetR/AcrR family transcriptional regulator [Saprospiraceae bacterium]|nr:TetR/AcrR family transcriptional regulator [Saprospiraceae bacterium]